MSYQPISIRFFRWLANTAWILPLTVGVAASTVFGVIALWLTWYNGTVALVATGQIPSLAVRAPVTLYMMVGFLPMATYYLCHWTDRHLVSIHRNFSLAVGPAPFPRVTANVLGGIGSITMYFLFIHEPADPFLIFDPARWSSTFAMPLFGLLLMGWLNFRFLLLLVRSAVIVSSAASRIEQINLLDSSAVKPFATHGVRSSMLAIVCLSVSANLWLDPDSPAIGTIASLVLLIGATVIALLLPTWGIHKRLKATKWAELHELRSSIHARRQIRDRTPDDSQHLRAELALESRLMAASEWPFDAGSYGRVALYVILGLGSWVGAALVERLLESLGA